MSGNVDEEVGMKRRLSVASLAGFLGVMATLAFAASDDGAAPPKKATKAATAKAAADDAKAEGKKAVRRLPMYYAQVVDEAQREKIYGIQAEFNEKTAPLRAQIEALEKDRDARIAAVLTPEQKKQLDDLKAAAKAGRDAAKKAAPKATPKVPSPGKSSAKKTDEAEK
jgi:hypothetical protein